MRILDNFVSEPRACAYLPTETSSLEYRVMLDVKPPQWERLLARGWRRFGVAYFRPKCRGCSECVPLRIPVARFVPSKSQRRVRNKTAHLRLETGPPLIDLDRLELYRAWHEMQADARGWSHDQITPERYFHEFAFPHSCVREFAYYDEERLVAVGIVDETPNSLSAVYTYHDPNYRKYSLGTASILRQIEMAQQKGKTWLYLGYRVLGCMSSQYKAKFKPHQLLSGWPTDEEEPVWSSSENSAGEAG